jgi:hypothetical protein
MDRGDDLANSDGAPNSPEPITLTQRFLQLTRAQLNTAAVTTQTIVEQHEDDVWREGTLRHAKIIEEFLHDESRRCCLFSIALSDPSTRPALTVGFTQPAAQIASELVIVMKLLHATTTTLTVPTLASQLQFISLTRAPMESAARLLARIYAAMASVLLHTAAPKETSLPSSHDPPTFITNHRGLPFEVQQEILTRFQHAKAHLEAQAASNHIAQPNAERNGPLQARILLPLLSEETLAWAEKTSETQSDAIVAHAAAVKTLEHLVTVIWTAQVKHAMRAVEDEEQHYTELKCIVARDSAGTSSDHDDSPPTPSTEFTFWHNRSAQLRDLHSQLSASASQRIASILTRSGSAAAQVTYTGLVERMSLAQKEAINHTKHLGLLKPYLERMFTAGETETGLTALVKRDLPSALKVLELLWSHPRAASPSQASSSTVVHPSWIALIHRLLANEIVEQGRKFLKRPYEVVSPQSASAAVIPAADEENPSAATDSASTAINTTPTDPAASFFDPSSPISSLTATRLSLVEQVCTGALKHFATSRTALNGMKKHGSAGAASFSSTASSHIFTHLHSFLSHLRALLSLLRRSCILFHLHRSTREIAWATEEHERAASHVAQEARRAMEEFLDPQSSGDDTDAASPFDPTNPAHTVRFRSRVAALESALDHLDEETSKLFRKAVRDAKSEKEKASVLENLIDFCDQHQSDQADEITGLETSLASPATILHAPSLLSSSSSASSFRALLRQLLQSLVDAFPTGELEACQLEYARAREQRERPTKGELKGGRAMFGALEGRVRQQLEQLTRMHQRLYAVESSSAEGGALQSAEEDAFDAMSQNAAHLLALLRTHLPAASAAPMRE